MKAETKVKIKLIAFDILFEIVVNGLIILFSILTNNLTLLLPFYICWYAFRAAVPIIFHFKGKTPLLSLVGCALTSSVISYLIMHNSMPINQSIFSSVIIGMAVHILLYWLADYRMLKNNELSIYKMTEDKLREYAISKGLSEVMIDTLILKVKKNYRWVDIRNELNYGRTTIDYHKQQIEKKLNIKF